MKRFPTLIMRAPRGKLGLVCGHTGEMYIWHGASGILLPFKREELFDLGVNLIEHGLRLKPDHQHEDRGEFWSFLDEKGHK